MGSRWVSVLAITIKNSSYMRKLHTQVKAIPKHTHTHTIAYTHTHKLHTPLPTQTHKQKNIHASEHESTDYTHADTPTTKHPLSHTHKFHTHTNSTHTHTQTKTYIHALTKAHPQIRTHTQIGHACSPQYSIIGPQIKRNVSSKQKCV